MESAWNRIKRTLGIIVPLSVTVSAASESVAHAQYTLEGSDTLTDVMKDAIAASGVNMVYSNVGSGPGEKDIAASGCPAAGITGANLREGIAPMSRNFQQAILTSCPSFAPSGTSVIGLDALVFASANFAGRCLNQTVPLANHADPTIADPTNPSDLSLLFFGYNTAGFSRGRTDECAHPNRLAALNRLVNCMGANDITHIYRTDDLTGTQDTMRERLQSNYWCNGKSEGHGAKAGSNMYNEDLDPIRRACIAQDATHAKTRCTYYPTAQTCSAGDPDITVTGYGAVKCTQGLVVALSENDPGSDDITVSIANRIKNDGFHQTLGMAGRAVVEQPLQPTAGMTVNTVTYTNGNVRANQYMFSRRLFLQQNPAGSGDAGRDAVEGPFFTWATNRVNMSPIIKNRGFITCFDDYTTSGCADAGNLCCITALAGSSVPNQNIGAETNGTFSDRGDNSHPCVQTGAMSVMGSSCGPIVTEAADFACNIGAKCTSGVCTPDSSGLGGTCHY
jgi:hypothetical protein